MIVVIDYDVGNVKSVTNAFQRIGCDVVVSRDHETIRQAKAIVLPGVGTFLVAMKNLEKYGLVTLLKEQHAKGVPILGICLGMQILFEMGYEVKPIKGLGFLEGSVRMLQCQAKIPHMGWNELQFLQSHPLLHYIRERDYVYFVHSFAADFQASDVVAYCEYGQEKIPAIVAKGQVMGCQFHPEKSGQVGQRILRAFKEMIQ